MERKMHVKRVVTFGEIMLRLKSPGFERFFQSNMLEATFGGGEANVAVSLANYGMDAAFVTVLPQNDIARACERELRGYGVDVSMIRHCAGRVGIYFLETGSNQRPSKVIYDRAESSIALAEPGSIDWDKSLVGADWFHFTGITPAISESAAELTLTALQSAKKLGVHVSCDLNFRKNLWKWGKRADEVMPELVRYVDTVIANEEDFQMALGMPAAVHVESGELDAEAYRTVASDAVKRFPNVARVAITLRESRNANMNDWSACMYDGNGFYVSRKYAITDIVDRVGGGDSFGGGLIFGLSAYDDARVALEFAVAASCLKHTVNGDFNLVTKSEVEALMKGSGSGRVQR